MSQTTCSSNNNNNNIDYNNCFILPERGNVMTPTPTSSHKRKFDENTKTVEILPQPNEKAPLTFVPKKRQATLLDYCASTTKVDSVLNEYYWVAKKDIPDLDYHKKELTATPTWNKLMVASGHEPFPVYTETSTRFGMPRFYGLEKFGKPTKSELSIGEPMAPDVKFMGELKNSIQYPQQQAVQGWEQAGCCGLVSAVCGQGKTVIAISAAISKGRKTMILVHAQNIADQWKDRLQQFAPKARIGTLVQDTIDIYDKDFVIGTIQSVYRRDYPDLDSFGFLIIDEAHRIGSEMYSKSSKKFRCRYMLTLSATPDRNDGLTKFIYWSTGPMVFKSFRSDKSPIHIKQIVYNDGNQQEVKYKGGRLGFAAMITRLIKDSKRNFLILNSVKDLLKIETVRQVMVISERRGHLEFLCDELKKEGLDVGLYYGGLKTSDLEVAKTKQVICASYGIASEALDISTLNAMVLATPYGKNEQIIGRLREDKQSTPRYCIDIVDPFSIFEHMSWKRKRIFEDLGYIVERKDMEKPTFY